MPAYDIIGDVHGHAELLAALLQKMGYEQRNGAWRHAERQALFVGDFIDRGPQQIEAIKIPRRMMDAGSAQAVMGNHEFNAIAWHTPNPEKPGDSLRTHIGPKGERNRRQHERFLEAVGENSDLHRELIRWFMELPLWLDLPELRVVHACWHEAFMEYLAPQLRPGARFTEELMPAVTREPVDRSEKDTPSPTPFKAAEAVTKGLEMPLPGGCYFVDKDGNSRRRVRVRWWDSSATTYRTAAMLNNGELLNDGQSAELSENPIPAPVRINPPASKPIFFGHYWLNGACQLQAPGIACVDYSAGNGGPLVAYRWDGENTLDSRKFCSVENR